MTIITYFNAATVLLCIFLWIGLVAYFRLQKKKSSVYLLFFTIFYIYIIKVLDFTLFQFQSLILLKYLMPHLMLRGETAEKSLNLIPLVTLTLKDLQTSLLNILLMIPFGFGLPFITRFRMKNVVIAGLFFSVTIEILQFVSGLLAKTTFRVADINDVIFNTVGVTVGYALFIGFMKIFRRIFNKSTNPILNFIAERP